MLSWRLTVDQLKLDKWYKISGKYAARADVKCYNELYVTIVHINCFDLIS